MSLAAAPPTDLAQQRAWLDALERGAEQSDSDGVAASIGGKVLLDHAWAKGPTQLESVTKLFTAIAIGMLVADGKIPSYDAPLATWFPEWKKTPKAAITLREVMQHRSGLADVSHTDELSAAKNASAWAAKKLPLLGTPDETRMYSNAAVALLARVIRTAAGKPEDEYLDERLFKPLGITGWSWRRDPSGNPHAWEGLALTAADLLKVGQTLDSGGTWQGKQVVPAEFVRAMSEGTDGLLVDILFDTYEGTQTPATRKRLAKLGVQHIEALAPLDHRGFSTLQAYFEAAVALLPPPDAMRLRELRSHGSLPMQLHGTHALGAVAKGAHGNVLAIISGKHAVVARVRTTREPDTFTLLMTLAVRLGQP